MLENRRMLLSFITETTVVCIGLSITNIFGAGALGVSVLTLRRYRTSLSLSLGGGEGEGWNRYLMCSHI